MFSCGMRTIALVLLALCLTVGGTAAAHGSGDPAYTLELVGPPQVPIGGAATTTLTASDEAGADVAGLRVRFVRSGPHDQTDASCSPGDLTACPVTDADGRAAYEFVGNVEGIATVTAEVYSVGGALVGTSGPWQVVVKNPIVVCRTSCINAKLTGRSTRGRDVLRVHAPAIARGGEVRLEKKTAGQWRQVGRSKRLDADGDRAFSLRDRNGRRVTRYRAVVDTGRYADITPVVRLR